MRRFHDIFFNLIFGGFFQIGPTVRLRLARRGAADGGGGSRHGGGAMASSHRRANELRFVGA